MAASWTTTFTCRTTTPRAWCFIRTSSTASFRDGSTRRCRGGARAGSGSTTWCWWRRRASTSRSFPMESCPTGRTSENSSAITKRASAIGGRRSRRASGSARPSSRSPRIPAAWPCCLLHDDGPRRGRHLRARKQYRHVGMQHQREGAIHFPRAHETRPPERLGHFAHADADPVRADQDVPVGEAARLLGGPAPSEVEKDHGHCEGKSGHEPEEDREGVVGKELPPRCGVERCHDRRHRHGAEPQLTYRSEPEFLLTRHGVRLAAADVEAHGIGWIDRYTR